VRKLPPDLANALLSILSFFSWLALPITFMSWLASLRLAVEFWTGLYDRVVALRPVLDAIVDAVAPFVLAWRELTQPVRGAMPVWLPFEAAEFVLMLLISAPPAVQWLRAHGKLRQASKLIEEDLRRLRDMEEVQ
jgi:hypothetical protein